MDDHKIPQRIISSFTSPPTLFPVSPSPPFLSSLSHPSPPLSFLSLTGPRGCQCARPSWPQNHRARGRSGSGCPARCAPPPGSRGLRWPGCSRREVVEVTHTQHAGTRRARHVTGHAWRRGGHVTLCVNARLTCDRIARQGGDTSLSVPVPIRCVTSMQKEIYEIVPL